MVTPLCRSIAVFDHSVALHRQHRRCWSFCSIHKHSPMTVQGATGETSQEGERNESLLVVELGDAAYAQAHKTE